MNYLLRLVQVTILLLGIFFGRHGVCNLTLIFFPFFPPIPFTLFLISIIPDLGIFGCGTGLRRVSYLHLVAEATCGSYILRGWFIMLLICFSGVTEILSTFLCLFFLFILPTGTQSAYYFYYPSLSFVFFRLSL